MFRRLGLTFVFFTVLSAVAAPAFASVTGCMYECGLTAKLTLAQCSRICGVGTTLPK